MKLPRIKLRGRKSAEEPAASEDVQEPAVTAPAEPAAGNVPDKETAAEEAPAPAPETAPEKESEPDLQTALEQGWSAVVAELGEDAAVEMSDEEILGVVATADPELYSTLSRLTGITAQEEGVPAPEAGIYVPLASAWAAVVAEVGVEKASEMSDEEIMAVLAEADPVLCSEVSALTGMNPADVPEDEGTAAGDIAAVAVGAAVVGAVAAEAAADTAAAEAAVAAEEALASEAVAEAAAEATAAGEAAEIPGEEAAAGEEVPEEELDETIQKVELPEEGGSGLYVVHRLEKEKKPSKIRKALVTSIALVLACSVATALLNGTVSTIETYYGAGIAVPLFAVWLSSHSCSGKKAAAVAVITSTLMVFAQYPGSKTFLDVLSEYVGPENIGNLFYLICLGSLAFAMVAYYGVFREKRLAYTLAWFGMLAVAAVNLLCYLSLTLEFVQNLSGITLEYLRANILRVFLLVMYAVILLGLVGCNPVSVIKRVDCPSGYRPVILNKEERKKCGLLRKAALFSLLGAACIIAATTLTALRSSEGLGTAYIESIVVPLVVLIISAVALVTRSSDGPTSHVSVGAPLLLLGLSVVGVALGITHLTGIEIPGKFSSLPSVTASVSNSSLFSGYLGENTDLVASVLGFAVAGIAAAMLVFRKCSRTLRWLAVLLLVLGCTEQGTIDNMLSTIEIVTDPELRLNAAIILGGHVASLLAMLMLAAAIAVRYDRDLLSMEKGTVEILDSGSAKYEDVEVIPLVTADGGPAGAKVNKDAIYLKVDRKVRGPLKIMVGDDNKYELSAGESVELPIAPDSGRHTIRVVGKYKSKFTVDFKIPATVVVSESRINRGYSIDYEKN